jgi:MSHA biogenesis protein MshN
VQQGQLKDAASGYEAALLLDPLYDKAREALVAVLLSNKANAEAEKVLQDGLALNEKQTRFAMLLARLQVERKALPQALQTLEKSLPYAGQQADYHAFIAALLQRQDRHAEAISQYQAALQLSPNSGVWLMGMAISLQALKRDEEARVSYKRAIETHSLSTALQSFVEQRLADLK